MTDDELAQFLTKAAAIYYDRRSLRLLPVLLDETIRELDSVHLLSLKAISAIVGCDEQHALEAAGPDAHRPRGKLNPAHIPTLGYMLSFKRPVAQEIPAMLKAGTSLSTIASLTNISQATLYRWRNR